ncbi:PLP-dependent aminotransferase family protein [Helicobacter anatolicus]|uniref:hypothetical protein n=1 Tax=Helicobacter anatolicus TaxID=2905874 RepID=UPI001E5315E4|nr:hypothetical protein [Helicobacter anatolicus]MCE3039067.1 hypothetical protein [Helicobacter anatolicus]
MRLEFLHNYPINHEANSLLMQEDFPNRSIFIQKKDYKEELAQKFGAKFAFPIGFDVFGLLGFFCFLGKKIAYGIGNHQQIFLAAKNKNGKKIALKKDTGEIDFESLEEAIREGCEVFVLPSINQDIFSRNDCKKVLLFLQEKCKDFILVIDVTLSVSLGEFDRVDDDRVFYLLQGENLGLLRNFGMVFTQRDIEIPFVLQNERIYEAFLLALEKRIKIKPWSKKEFFAICRENLGDKVGLFTPLENSATNTLALRFDKIKARVLLQDLFIQNIYGANGQECLFGLFRPSFVLQEMGYLQDESRELLALSAAEILDIREVANRICESYLQITTLGI